MVLLDRGMMDWSARIVDGFVDYAGGVGLRSPSEIIHGFRPVAFAGGVDLVDRYHFARLRLGEQVLIVKAPPCGRVAAESLPGILRIGARPGRDVDNIDLDLRFQLLAEITPMHCVGIRGQNGDRTASPVGSSRRQPPSAASPEKCPPRSS